MEMNLDQVEGINLNLNLPLYSQDDNVKTKLYDSFLIKKPRLY